MYNNKLKFKQPFEQDNVHKELGIVSLNKFGYLSDVDYCRLQ